LYCYYYYYHHHHHNYFFHHHTDYLFPQHNILDIVPSLPFSFTSTDSTLINFHTISPKL
jgi:hypothetical protein